MLSGCIPAQKLVWSLGLIHRFAKFLCAFKKIIRWLVYTWNGKKITDSGFNKGGKMVGWKKKVEKIYMQPSLTESGRWIPRLLKSLSQIGEMVRYQSSFSATCITLLQAPSLPLCGSVKKSTSQKKSTLSISYIVTNLNVNQEIIFCSLYSRINSGMFTNWFGDNLYFYSGFSWICMRVSVRITDSTILLINRWIIDYWRFMYKRKSFI